MLKFFGRNKNDQEKQNLYQILFSTYAKEVYKVAYYILKDHQEAEEIVQETFMIAFDKLHTLKDQNKFSQWICTIGCNLAKRRYQRRKKEIPIDYTEPIFSEVLEQHTFSLPDEVLEEKEFTEYIREQIRTLKEPYKEIVILYYYNHLSYQEIAESLHISIGTVKSRIARAKKQILANIEKDDWREGEYIVGRR